MDEKMDWNDPEARLALAERVGTKEYNRRMLAYKEANPIQVVPTRYGVAYWVTEAQVGFSTREEAEACLAERRGQAGKGGPDKMPRRGYFHLKEAWYSKHLEPERDIDDEVMFGLYHTHEPTTGGEMRMEWVWIDGWGPVPRLSVFDEAFHLIRRFDDVWDELSGMMEFGPREFCEMLQKLGFADLTDRVGPKR